MKVKPCTVLTVLLAGLIMENCATPIKKLYKKPERYQGKTVRIKGRVISSLELLDLDCFTVRDKAAKIVVVTENLLPLKNDKVRIKGVFERNFQYREQKMVIIKENKLKGRKLLDAKTKIEKL